MALSASVCSPLKLSQPAAAAAAKNSRDSLDQRSLRLASSPYPLSMSVLNGIGGSQSSSGIRLAVGGVLGLRRKQQRLLVKASENNSSNQSAEETSKEADVEALEARLGIGKRARKQQAVEGGSGQAEPAKLKQTAKKWESRSLAEKAWSVYIDPDKGILFWINKLAYGAIFTVIGGWIVFRFIGPALGWYELDQPLLSPDRILDGGP